MGVKLVPAAPAIPAPWRLSYQAMMQSEMTWAKAAEEFDTLATLLPPIVSVIRLALGWLVTAVICPPLVSLVCWALGPATSGIPAPEQATKTELKGSAPGWAVVPEMYRWL